MELLMCVMMYCTDISNKWYDVPYENITINKDMSWFVWDEYIVYWRIVNPWVRNNDWLIRCEIK